MAPKKRDAKRKEKKTLKTESKAIQHKQTCDNNRKFGLLKKEAAEVRSQQSTSLIKETARRAAVSNANKSVAALRTAETFRQEQIEITGHIPRREVDTFYRARLEEAERTSGNAQESVDANKAKRDRLRSIIAEVDQNPSSNPDQIRSIRKVARRELNPAPLPNVNLITVVGNPRRFAGVSQPTFEDESTFPIFEERPAFPTKTDSSSSSRRPPLETPIEESRAEEERNDKGGTVRGRGQGTTQLKSGSFGFKEEVFEDEEGRRLTKLRNLLKRT